jgi:hypothetical protein
MRGGVGFFKPGAMTHYLEIGEKEHSRVPGGEENARKCTVLESVCRSRFLPLR